MQGGSYSGGLGAFNRTQSSAGGTFRLGESSIGYVARLGTDTDGRVSNEFEWLTSIECSHNATSAAVTGEGNASLNHASHVKIRTAPLLFPVADCGASCFQFQCLQGWPAVSGETFMSF